MADAEDSTTAAATSRMVSRLSIDVFWIQRNASGSVMPNFVCSSALGPVDELAGLEPLGQVGDLRLQSARSRVPADRDLDGRHRSAAVNGFTT